MIRSIHEFLTEIFKIRDSWHYNPDGDSEIWFRGVCDESLSLLPGAYWRKNCEEESLYLSFQAMVPTYVQRVPNDNWEWYYLMQHYRLPTRLLDWTENPLVALFFALEDEAKACNPCVWLMLPSSLNSICHGTGFIFIPNHTNTTKWLPGECGRGVPTQTISDSKYFSANEFPVAIFPKRHNPRIVAQRGAFTVHGTKEIPINKIFESSKTADGKKLCKLTIDRIHAKSILKDLRTIGINHTALFPEAESISKDLKKLYGVSD